METAARLPLRWRIAGRVNQLLPQVRGRQHLLNLIRGSKPLPVTYDVPLAPGLAIEADLQVSAPLFQLEYVRPALAPVFDLVLRPGDLVIDVGASDGVYTCWGALRVGPSGTVIAVEPIPATSQRLRATVKRNELDQIVEISSAAAGSAPGRTVIWLPNATNAHTLASAGRMPDSAPVEVPVVRLDALAYGRPVRLIKLDVEGYEAEVLEGAREILAGAQPPVIVLEVLQRHLARLGRTADEVISPLRAAGYECYWLTSRGLEMVIQGTRHSNVVALHGATHGDLIKPLRRLRMPRNQNY